MEHRTSGGSKRSERILKGDIRNAGFAQATAGFSLGANSLWKDIVIREYEETGHARLMGIEGYEAPSGIRNRSYGVVYEIDPSSTATEYNFIEEICKLRSVERIQERFNVNFTPDFSKIEPLRWLELHQKTEIPDFDSGLFFKSKKSSKQPIRIRASMPKVEVPTRVVAKKYHCKCQKSKCSKKYCECAKLGEGCDSTCQCANCQNKQKDHKKTIVSLESSDQGTCNCKKSSCNNNYCPCHMSGITCSPLCSCFGCKNIKKDDKEESHIEDNLRCSSDIGKREYRFMNPVTGEMRNSIDLFVGKKEGQAQSRKSVNVTQIQFK